MVSVNPPTSKAAWGVLTTAVKKESYTESSQVDVWMSRVNYLRACQSNHVPAETEILDNLGTRKILIPGKNVAAEGIRPLTQALFNNTLVRELDVSENNLSGEGTRFICEMLQKNYSIEKLNLSNNGICVDDGSIAIEDMLKSNMGLLRLDISDNKLGDRDGKHIAEGLSNNRTLECLNLSHNLLTATASQSLGHALVKNKWLRELNLDSNQLKSRGVVALCNAMLHCSHLESLSVADNDFGYDGAVAVSRLVRFNKRLSRLDISRNNIAWEALMLIGKALALNSVLEELKMAGNPVTSQGVIDLLNALFSNSKSAVKFLDLSGIKVTPKCIELGENISEKQEFILRHGGLLSNENVLQRKRDYTQTTQQQRWASHLNEEKHRISTLFKSIERYNFVKACEEHAAMMAEMDDEDDEVTYGEAMTSASQISGMLHQLKKPSKSVSEKKLRQETNPSSESDGLFRQSSTGGGADGDLPHLGASTNQDGALFQESRETYKKWENVRLPKLQTAAAIREEEEIATPMAAKGGTATPPATAPGLHRASSDKSSNNEKDEGKRNSLSGRETKSAPGGNTSGANSEKQKKKGTKTPKSGKRS